MASSSACTPQACAACASTFRWVVPARTPAVVAQRLNAEINNALRDPAVIELAGKLGVNLVGGTAQRLAEVQKADSATWAKVIRDGQTKAD